VKNRLPVRRKLQKQALRLALLRRRQILSEGEVVAASAAIQEHVRRLPAFQAAGVVLAYAACRNEVQTDVLVREALTAGKRVAFPVTDPVKKALFVRAINRYPDDLVPGAYGIPEPKPSCPAVAPDELDLVLVPGVAFDWKGFRLGYGGGYYDRFLPQVRESTTTVGLAYRFQVVDTVYPEKHDRRVRFVATEETVIETKTGVGSKR
jgi:5-formyltetrahydrofolate cyclo-ligase